MDLTKQLNFARRMASQPEGTPATNKRTEPPTQEEIGLQCGFMQRNGYTALNSALYRNLGHYIATRKLMQDKKGLFFFGDVGTGKSLWMRKFSGMRIVSAKRLVDLYQHNKDAYEELVDPPRYDEMPKRSYCLCIDDLGNEDPIKHFGTNVDVMTDIIYRRYDMFIQRGGRYNEKYDDRYITNFTSNKNEKWLEDRYDTRIVSRLREMCTFVKFEGQDQRRKV